jgi:hypothetical protein
MGGFEGADHRNSRGVALDPARDTGHRLQLDEDYARLARLGLADCESLGWHLGEGPGAFDFSRLRRVAATAERHGVHVLRTLHHDGVPRETPTAVPAGPAFAFRTRARCAAGSGDTRTFTH